MWCSAYGTPRAPPTCFRCLVGLQGHAMYYGPAEHAIDWFDRLGYTLPYGINAADFILDLASSDVATKKRCGTCRLPLRCIPQRCVSLCACCDYIPLHTSTARVHASSFWKRSTAC